MPRKKPTPRIVEDPSDEDHLFGLLVMHEGIRDQLASDDDDAVELARKLAAIRTELLERDLDAHGSGRKGTKRTPQRGRTE